MRQIAKIRMDQLASVSRIRAHIVASPRSSKRTRVRAVQYNSTTRPRLRSVATIEPASAAFSIGRFGSRPVERPFHKLDGIDCRPELRAKTLNRLVHRHRQFPPPVDNVANRF